MGCCCSTEHIALQVDGSGLKRVRVVARLPRGRLRLPKPSSDDALAVNGDLAASDDRFVVVQPPSVEDLCNVCSRQAACHAVKKLLLVEGKHVLVRRKLDWHNLSLINFSVSSEKLRTRLRREVEVFCEARSAQVDALHAGHTIVADDYAGSTWCGHL